MLSTITQFLGHFHPLVVHLPIGILLMALLIQWLSVYPKFESFKPVVPFFLLCGMISAILSCISGYLLSISDDYNEPIVRWHKYMGISVAVASALLFARERKVHLINRMKYLPVALFALLIVTGHLGGLLTHGSDYLSGPLMDIFKNEKTANTVIAPIPNVQEAVAFTDVIQPILQTKCYSCHGSNKQKGGLRMDDTSKLMKGGKNGIVIDPHKGDECEMIKRLLLPADNEDHMPPKEKPQPSESQISLLRWWISNGADFIKKVKDIPQSEKMKPILLALQQPSVIENTLSSVPEKPIEKADTAIIEKLREKGIVVLPVGKESNYLSANFITNTDVNNDNLEILSSLKKQLIWLKMGFTTLSDKQMAKIGQLHNVTRLSIDHTAVTDEGIQQLKSLRKLQYLNVVGTSVTAKGIVQLKDLKELRSIYVYQTKIEKSDWSQLQKALPETRIDSGGYIVPLLSDDTIVVKFANK